MLAKNLLLAAVIASSSLVGSSVAVAHDDLETVPFVDKDKYLGKWVAHKSLKLFFNRRCDGETAEYGVKDDGNISVLNKCWDEDGDFRAQTGTAVIVDPVTNAKLEVTFDRWYSRILGIKGDYQVLALTEDEQGEYSHVMIGSANRRSLWLMSRDGTYPDDILNEYLDNAESQGFDTGELVDNIIPDHL